MEKYLVERETLAQLVDALINKKYPDRPVTDFKELKEESIRALDDKIYDEVFGDLTKEQTEELNALLDNPDMGDQDFKNFFKTNNIDLEARITKAYQDFSEEFLGGDKWA